MKKAARIPASWLYVAFGLAAQYVRRSIAKGSTRPAL